MKFITKISLKITFFMIRRIIKNHYITELIPKRHEYFKCFLDIVFERQGQMASLAIFYQTFLKSEETSTSSFSFHEASLSEHPNPYRYHFIFWKVFKKLLVFYTKLSSTLKKNCTWLNRIYSCKEMVVDFLEILILLKQPCHSKQSHLYLSIPGYKSVWQKQAFSHACTLRSQRKGRRITRSKLV